MLGLPALGAWEGEDGVDGGARIGATIQAEAVAVNATGFTAALEGEDALGAV